MVLISNVIFTLTELFLLGYFFKEISFSCDDYKITPLQSPSVALQPPTVDTFSSLIKQSLCKDVINIGSGPSLPGMHLPHQTLWVDKSAQHGPRQTYFLGCYQFRSLIDKEDKLFGWEVIEGYGDDPDRISGVYGSPEFPNITLNGHIAFRDD